MAFPSTRRVHAIAAVGLGALHAHHVDLRPKRPAAESGDDHVFLKPDAIFGTCVMRSASRSGALEILGALHCEVDREQAVAGTLPLIVTGTL